MGRLGEMAESDPAEVSTLLRNAHIAAWVERYKYRHQAVTIEVGLNI
jgi:hypothetical protein